MGAVEAEAVQIFDAAQCQVEVFTFKEGVLSAIAHDLRLRVQRVRAEVQADRVRAALDVASLQVVCARTEGRDAVSLLSPGDRQKIETTLRDEVLEVRRFPEVMFESSSLVQEPDSARVEGRLTLHGVTRPVMLEFRRDGADWLAEVALHQPDFGIRPYRAMLGALKLQPAVRIAIRVTGGRGSTEAP